MYEGNSASFRPVSCRLGASVGVRTRFGTEPRSSRPPIFASSETPRPRPSKGITRNAKSNRFGSNCESRSPQKPDCYLSDGEYVCNVEFPKKFRARRYTQILSVPLLRNSRQTAASNRLSPRDSPKRRILFGTPFCRISLTTRSIEGVRPAAKRSAWAEVMHAVWAGVGALLRH